jgi:hypothetical protein
MGISHLEADNVNAGSAAGVDRISDSGITYLTKVIAFSLKGDGGAS